MVREKAQASDIFRYFKNAIPEQNALIEIVVI